MDAVENLNDIRNQAEKEISEASSSNDLEALRVRYLGRKGPIQNLMKFLKDVPPEERPAFGKQVNDLKVFVQESLDAKKEAVLNQEESRQGEEERIDVTLPGRRRFLGRKHLINQVVDRMVKILVEMGFSIQDGPHVETDYYNFEALNFEPDHPARDMQDTFYIEPNVLLRTHTSNVQVHVMENSKPPIRIIAPGKVYRNEAISARSHVFFHQLEGLYVDKDVTFADLMTTMKEFLKKFFEKEVETRFRPSYFPFVEPGMEVDVRCLVCEGKGCPVCKKTGWLEILGAGMVHPEVLKYGGIDPEEYSGYAWGMGIDRLVMIKYGIKDIRIFTENNLNFISQFPEL